MKEQNKIDSSYLKQVKLSGYKSIQNVEIDFKKGLNIIIGKNAAGKTNFLSFLNKSLDFSFEDMFNFSSTLVFENGKDVVLEFKNEMPKGDFDAFDFVIDSSRKNIAKVNNELIENTTAGNMKGLWEEIQKYNLFFANTFIRHGVPKDFYFVDAPYSFTVDETLGISVDMYKQVIENDTPYFIKLILLRFLGVVAKLKENGIYDDDKIRVELIKTFARLDETIKKAIIKYSPIEDIRFNKNFNVFLDKGKENYTVNNLFIEFKIEGSWHPFSNLSDGTKRLFYVIAEVVSPDHNRITRDTVVQDKNAHNRIILLEEPELGVHPHQLIQLMQFLKENSRNKQIIIATHSPQVIDILGKDDLDRIILAYANGSERTKLRHLNEREISKAQQYMKEDYLSDYWLYSDLEK